MDLSFPRFDREIELTVLPSDLAVLMVGVAARQAAADPRLFAPLDGAFNGPMAGALTAWKKE